MSDYTIKNLKEIDDAAVGYGLSPSLEARFARKPLGCEKGGLGYQRYAPNFRLSFGHKHAEQEELYIVLSGGGQMKIGDDIVDLKQWDIVRVGPDTMRNFKSGPDGAELLAFGAGESGDSEQVQDWWTD